MHYSIITDNGTEVSSPEPLRIGPSPYYAYTVFVDGIAYVADGPIEVNTHKSEAWIDPVCKCVRSPDVAKDVARPEHKRELTVNDFKPGDLVEGPFFNSPNATGRGVVAAPGHLGVRDTSMFVSVCVTEGNRNSGGYFPNELTKLS